MNEKHHLSILPHAGPASPDSIQVISVSRWAGWSEGGADYSPPYLAFVRSETRLCAGYGMPSHPGLPGGGSAVNLGQPLEQLIALLGGGGELAPALGVGRERHHQLPRARRLRALLVGDALPARAPRTPPPRHSSSAQEPPPPSPQAALRARA